MKLAKALDDKIMDTRLVDRLMAQGKVTKEEVDKHLSNLPDETGNFDNVDDKTGVTQEAQAPTE